MITKVNIRRTSDRCQDDTLSPKLLELRKKIRDNDYVDSAIQRIAQVISKRLVENTLQDNLRH